MYVHVATTEHHVDVRKKLITTVGESCELLAGWCVCNASVLWPCVCCASPRCVEDYATTRLPVCLPACLLAYRTLETTQKLTQRDRTEQTHKPPYSIMYKIFVQVNSARLRALLHTQTPFARHSHSSRVCQALLSHCNGQTADGSRTPA